jgi:hypothetical protein
VNGDDRRGAIRDAPIEALRVEPERVVDFREHGHRAGRDDRVHRRDERERRHHDLVAAADAERRERAAQRGCAVGDPDGVRAAERLADGALEAGHRAVRVVALVPEQRARREHFGDGSQLVLTEPGGALGPVERAARLGHDSDT